MPAASGAAPYDAAAAAAHLAATDARLARLIAHVGPCRLEIGRMATPFASLLRAIVFQQLSGRAASTIFARLAAHFPDERPEPAALLALPTETLRAAGLSRAKAAAAHDLAARTIDGTVPDRQGLDSLDDEAIIDRLTAVRGVGRWTVEMLLIFELGRPDVLPVTDLGVRRGFARLHGLDELPAPADLRQQGTRWRPYRSVAAWYLWRGSELTALPD